MLVGALVIYLILVGMPSMPVWIVVNDLMLVGIVLRLVGLF